MTIENFDYPDGTTNIPNTTVWGGGSFVVENGELTTSVSVGDSVAVYDIISDGLFEATFKTNLTPSDVGSSSNMGFVFRAVDESNKWVFRSNGLTPPNIRIQRIVSGSSTMLYDQQFAGITYEDARKMSIEAEGDNLKFYINDTLVYQVSDSTHNTATKVGLRLDLDRFSVDDFYYGEAPAPSFKPRTTYTQKELAVIAEKVGQSFLEYAPAVVSGGGEEFWFFGVNMDGVVDWPVEKYPVALYSSTDHSGGTAGIYLRVWNSTLGDIEDAESWELWDDVSGRSEFSHITQKTNPIFVDDTYNQTETSTIIFNNGVINMFYHVNNYDGGFADRVQATCLARGTNGVDLTTHSRGFLAYDPEREQGDGHTGYFSVTENPITTIPYTYIGYALHGGGAKPRSATTGWWGSNDLENWTLIKTWGWQSGEEMDYLSGYDETMILRGAFLETLEPVRNYYRCVFTMRKDISDLWSTGTDNSPFVPAEVLLDSDLNVVSDINVIAENGSSGADAREIHWGHKFTYGGTAYTFTKVVNGGNAGAIGLLKLNETVREWTIVRSYKDKAILQSNSTSDYTGLTASANTSITDDGDTISFALPSNGDSAYVSGDAITLVSGEMTEMSLLRHGKVDEGDVSGIVGLVDDPANVTNGVVLKWPSFADGTQQLTLQLIGGGVTSEVATRKWVGVESIGDLSDDYEASQAKQNYGIRIIPDENRILVMDGGAVIEQVIAENVDLTQALKPAIIMQSNDSTARATEFEAITVNSYSNEQIAPATVFSDVVSTLAITGSYETDLYDNSGALAYSGEITYDSGAAFISGLDTGLNAEIFGTVFVDGVNIAVKSVSDIDDYSSSITATLEDMPAGTYNIRVTNVDENTTVYSAQKTLISETFTIDFSNVQKGTNCEVFVLTPDDLPAGGVRGVTE